MRTCRALAGLALLTVGLAPSLAGAWCVTKYPSSTGYGSWENVPIKYRVSANLTDAAILAAIDKAFQTWAGVGNCSKLSFQKDATFTFAAIPFKQATGAIFIYWVSDAKDWAATGVGQENYIYRYGGYDMKGFTTSSSLAINAFKYTWKASGASASEFDVQNVLTHFIGFALGLEKSNVATSVMGQQPSFALSPDLRTLTQDDKDAILFLYPSKATGCTTPAAPGANNCSGPTPPPPGDGVKKDSGPPPPPSDAKPPAGDGTTPPAGDGKPPATSDLYQPPPQYDSGKPATGCKSNNECASDEICSIDGLCVKTGGGEDGCGCEIGTRGRTPLLAFLLLALACCFVVFRRRR